MAIILDGTTGITTIGLTADTNLMFLDVTNNYVGINTASPNVTLDVNNTTSIIKNTSTAGTTQVALNQSNFSGNFYTGLDNNSGSYLTGQNYAGFHWMTGSYPMIFATANTERMRIDSTGNVGIGNPSPNTITKFYVEQSAGNVLGYFNSVATSQNARIRINSTDNASSVAYVWSYSHASLNKQASIYLTSTGGLATQLGQTAGSEPTSGNTVMFIDSTGNMGIGTGSPSYKLHVAGNIGAPSSRLDISSITDPNNQGVRLTGNGDTYFQQISATSNALYFSQWNGSTWSERMRITSNGYILNAANNMTSGLVQSQLYFRLNSYYGGTNATGAQNLFGVGVTLTAATVYEFEMAFNMGRTAGTTSHTIAFGFGGNASLNNILYQGYYNLLASATPQGGSASAGSFVANTAGAVVSTVAITTNNTAYFYIKGTLSVNAAGTLIPQYTLSAAPGGAYATFPGSYIKLSPISVSGANTSIGTWA